MIQDKLMKIILAPCISEKANNVQIYRQYVFRVNNKARREEVAKAVKLMFGVEVEAVRVCRVKGKKRNFKNVPGKKSDWKKAYVTLKEGQAINLGRA